jgi:hypothetical protein
MAGRRMGKRRAAENVHPYIQCLSSTLNILSSFSSASDIRREATNSPNIACSFKNLFRSAILGAVLYAPSCFNSLELWKKKPS